mgnify:CR=1 FL=1
MAPIRYSIVMRWSVVKYSFSVYELFVILNKRDAKCMSQYNLHPSLNCSAARLLHDILEASSVGEWVMTIDGHKAHPA